MSIILSIAYILFVIITMTLLLKDSKHRSTIKESENKNIISSQDKKLITIVTLATYFSLMVIGYLLNCDAIMPFTLRKNGGSISFIGLTINFSITLLIVLIIQRNRKRRI